MTVFEQQMTAGKKMMALNLEWVRSLAEIETANFRKYVEINQQFARKLPDVQDLESFIKLQSDYTAQLWDETQDIMRHRGELLTQAVSQHSDAMNTLLDSMHEGKP